MSMIQLGPDLDGKAVDDGLLQPISLTHAKTMVAAGASKNSGHSSGLGQKWIQWNASIWTQVGLRIKADTVLKKNGASAMLSCETGNLDGPRQSTSFEKTSPTIPLATNASPLTAAETATLNFFFSEASCNCSGSSSSYSATLTDIQNATNDSSTIKQTN